ncbi:MAG: alpha-galactosidase, partial [Oscillospiraceae bacterium]|nr:alpha-galactosidase [Oscillospiraceae bacterium]
SIFELYASWGVDFINVDDICRELPHEEAELKMRSEALHNCGRDMVLSLSPGPALPEKAELYKEVANMWRITDDFWDKWELLYDMFSRAQTWCIHAGAGHFPDCDMLPIGNILQDYDKSNTTKFTKDEQITMLTLWSVMRSPLIIGGEMTRFDEFTMSLLTNRELLEVLNNTHSAHPLFRRKNAEGEEIAWFTSHTNGESYYIALFNAGESERDITAALPIERELAAYDIWLGEPAGNVKGSVTARIKPHGAKIFKLTAV